MTKLLALFALVALVFNSTIAMAADLPAAANACSGMLCQVMGNFPDVNAWLIAIFTFLGLMLRVSADLLGFASTKLGKSDSGWAQRLSDWALFCASVVGWFGGGTPKAVLQAKVEAHIEKQGDKPA